MNMANYLFIRPETIFYSTITVSHPPNKNASNAFFWWLIWVFGSDVVGLVRRSQNWLFN